MSDVTVFEKPTCTTCRELSALLADRGVEMERIDYQVMGVTRAQLDEIIAKSGLSARDILRTKESEYTELALNDAALSEEAILDAIAAHPVLLQRPVVIKGERAVLARPAEKVLELF
jgi:arsenate reductase